MRGAAVVVASDVVGATGATGADGVDGAAGADGDADGVADGDVAGAAVADAGVPGLAACSGTKILKPTSCELGGVTPRWRLLSPSPS